VAGAGERDHEAVALTLFDRPHTVVGNDDLKHCAIKLRDGFRHLLGLGLPQTRRTLDIGEKQRHRSRWQKHALTHVAPVHQWRLRAEINLAHASQPAATASPNHQLKRLEPRVADAELRYRLPEATFRRCLP
jgi:hypothetical protein